MWTGQGTNWYRTEIDAEHNTFNTVAHVTLEIPSV